MPRKILSATHVRLAGGGKRDKTRWLSDYYETAKNSVGLPVDETTAAMTMFRMALMESSIVASYEAKSRNWPLSGWQVIPIIFIFRTFPALGPFWHFSFWLKAGI